MTHARPPTIKAFEDVVSSVEIKVVEQFVPNGKKICIRAEGRPSLLRSSQILVRHECRTASWISHVSGAPDTLA
jgi:hypothetical protein